MSAALIAASAALTTLVHLLSAAIGLTAIAVIASSLLRAWPTIAALWHLERP